MGLDELRRDLGMEDPPDAGPKRAPKGPLAPATAIPLPPRPPTLPGAPPSLDEAPAPVQMPSILPPPSAPIAAPAPDVGPVAPARPPIRPMPPVTPPASATPDPQLALRDYAAPNGTKVTQQIGGEDVTWEKTGRNEWQGWVGGIHRKLTGESALNLAANRPPDVKPAPPPPSAPESWIARTGRGIAEQAGIPIAPPGAPVQSPWKAGVAPFASTPGEMGENLKKNAPNIATDAVLGLVPGSGIAKSVLRGALATGAGTGAAALTGQDPSEAAFKSGVSATAGEGVGGLARAGARWAQGAFSQTTKNFGDLVGKFIPSFKGATPQETVARLVNGTGYNQLGKDYGAAVQGVLTQHGDPVVLVPALERFGKSPAQPASSALETIQSLRRSLFTGGGDLGRNPDAILKQGWIEDAMREWQEALGKQLPATSMKVMDAAKADYARGMSILRVMGEGHEHMGKEALASLIQKGRINEPGIEQSFLLNAGKLKERFTPEEYAALENAIRRGETNPLAMSQVGKPSQVIMGHGVRPVPRMSVPHAPIRIGKPEEVADLVSRVFRLLGGSTAQGVLDE